jgi:hypothetical protein
MSETKKPKDVVFNLAYAWQNVPPKTIISSWKKLWPSHPLSSGSSEVTGPEESELLISKKQ